MCITLPCVVIILFSLSLTPRTLLLAFEWKNNYYVTHESVFTNQYQVFNHSGHEPLDTNPLS